MEKCDFFKKIHKACRSGNCYGILTTHKKMKEIRCEKEEQNGG